MDIPKQSINFAEREVKLERSDELIGKRDVLSGGCRGCFGIVNLKMMSKTYYYEGKAEIYSDMLMFCFSIKFEEIDKDNDLDFICGVCIRKLRKAADFKRQLEGAQSALKDLKDVNFILPDESDSLGAGDLFWVEIDSEEDDDVKPVIENLPGVEKECFPKDKTKLLEGQNHAAALSNKYVNNNTSKLPNENIQRQKRKRKSEAFPFELNTKDLRCKICNAEFLWIKNLKMHMSVHYPNHVCETCGHLSATRKQHRQHSYTHSKTMWPCKLCPDKTYKNLTALQVHHKIKHLGKIQMYKCLHCNERFKHFHQRRKHLIKMHNYLNKKYSCKLCEKEFEAPSTLSTHVRIVHLNERNHKCDQCDQAFFFKKCLREHMLCHSSEKNFPCQYCEKRFKRKYTLTAHEKIHTREKRHVCNLCGDAFTLKASLKEHISVHNPQIKSNIRK